MAAFFKNCYYAFEKSRQVCVLFSALVTYRSSRLEVFFKIGALKKFAKFTGRLLCRSFFFDKAASFFYRTLRGTATENNRFMS